MLPGFHSKEAMPRHRKANILFLCILFRKNGRNTVHRYGKEIFSLYFRNIRIRKQVNYTKKVRAHSSTYHSLLRRSGITRFKLFFIFIHTLVGDLVYLLERYKLIVTVSVICYA